MDCIFCKISNGEILSYKVYEDQNFIAFLDINPFAKGHTLLVPKKHEKWVWDLEEKEYLRLMAIVKKIAMVLRIKFNTEWVVEGIAGIDVPHAHVHIIPRQLDDGLGAFPNKVLSPKPNEEEMRQIAQELSKQLL